MTELPTRFRRVCLPISNARIPHSALIPRRSMMMRPSTRAAMATAALISGRAGAFLSSGGFCGYAGMSRTTAARCLSMVADNEKVGFIGEERSPYHVSRQRASLLCCCYLTLLDFVFLSHALVGVIFLLNSSDRRENYYSPTCDTYMGYVC